MFHSLCLSPLHLPSHFVLPSEGLAAGSPRIEVPWGLPVPSATSPSPSKDTMQDMPSYTSSCSVSGGMAGYSGHSTCWNGLQEGVNDTTQEYIGLGIGLQRWVYVDLCLEGKPTYVYIYVHIQPTCTCTQVQSLTWCYVLLLGMRWLYWSWLHEPPCSSFDASLHILSCDKCQCPILYATLHFTCQVISSCPAKGLQQGLPGMRCLGVFLSPQPHD